jgi:hypothetical protein
MTKDQPLHIVTVFTPNNQQCCNITVFIVFFFLLQASVVLGQFLVLKKNKELFQDWMKDVCGANTKQSSDCYQCLSDWCDEFL